MSLTFRWILPTFGSVVLPGLVNDSRSSSLLSLCLTATVEHVRHTNQRPPERIRRPFTSELLVLLVNQQRVVLLSRLDTNRSEVELIAVEEYLNLRCTRQLTLNQRF